MSLRAYAALLSLGAIWGTTFLYVRVAVQADVSPLQVVFFSAIGGAVALLVLGSLQHRRIELTTRRFAGAAFLSFVATFLPFALIAWGEERVASGPASILSATEPLFVIALASVFYTDERLRPERALGIAIGLVGVLILVGGGVRDLVSANLVGQLAILLAILLYAVANVTSRYVLRTWEPQALSAVQITLLVPIAGVLVVPLGGLRFDLSWDVWLALLALGVLGTGIAYRVYYWLIDEVGSVRSSLVTYVIPIVGVTAGAAVLDERIAWNTFAGGAVILLGVAIVNGLGDRLWHRPIATPGI